MIGTGIGLGLSGYRLATGPSFQPTLVSGLELWLDASDLSTLYQSSGGSLATADGDPVGQWRDKSGNLRHATQTDGTKKPALKLAIKNGLSALRMDGSNDSFDLGDNFKHQSITVIAVQKITTTGVCVTFSRGGAGSYNPAVAMVYNRSTPNTSATFNPSGGSQVVNVAITQNQFSIFRAMADGSTFTNTTNGTTATAAQTAALQFNTNSVTIGCMETYGLNAAGDYCELIIYSKALNASEWSSVNSYLNTKWSIY